MVDVLVGQIGFNPLDALKQVARTSAQVAADQRTQRVAATAANAYYPEQYRQVQQGVDQARQVLRKNDPNYRPRVRQMPMPLPMPPMQPFMDDDNLPTGGQVQHGNLLMIGGAVVAAGLLFLLLRK